MLRIASKLSSRFSSSSTALTANPLLPTRLSPIPSSSFRPFTNGLELEANMVVPDAIKMINYALRHWRTDRSLGAYRMGLSVLKICITNELTEGKEPKRENSKGMAMLAMSTLLFERGEYAEAIEKLEGVQELTNSYLGVRVAALETQAGLHLLMRQDDLAAVVADKCMKMVENQEKPLEYEERFVDYEAQFVRAKALKGLIELVNGNADSAEDFFDKSLREKYCDGTAGLSYAEFLHKIGNYPMAKEVYRNVVQGAIEVKNAGRPYLGAGNMSVDELIVGSMFALGQLELLMGNYSNAECHLTQALSRAEEAYGDSKHPTVGVALTSIALLYRRKAIQEHSSSLLVQEGLYRKVIDILKVPTMETESEDAAPLVDRSDIAALATGAYAEVLSVQEKRQAEGEKMKNLAESLWKHRWLSLANAIDSDKNIIDSRICRIL
ncbi:hypothetical protein GLYMA_18G185200v4 [Glycine max]|uniref:MalT-like TPR region domain-containing protein n=2 Tax=Glycine subgen. Soja TaxID=1462606 RepID=I1N2K4_SOYBN|nr:uncharacterized protein LOC100782211 [Glycine max]XP_028214810.1 uncharacterized protein LOC114396827 [Glycine soja]KAG5095195.1 hypothetical protein JHK84_050783 [Glycine max]KAH1155075.1 hypothetical protein GYH30_050392 [Glycine max]KHN04718.1 hypothetical protein glysoja_041219 [Glycine soja]KRH00014.1 hypothetical protein GLYMA_18G185200v4 [Glycine max]RZB52616.1 hypothetical protein D0Y65_048900 [Glycine soja]|eukprot:XP_006602604.1 uncharacterized protein LOC100782211 [Glycine max]